MKRKNSFPLTKQGLEDCSNYTDYVGIAKEFIENHPEVLPIALLAVVGVSVFALSPMASVISVKSGALDISEVAFKYLTSL